MDPQKNTHRRYLYYVKRLEENRRIGFYTFNPNSRKSRRYLETEGSWPSE